MHMAIRQPGRLRGMVIVDPLGAVGDGGEADMLKIMAERIPPEHMARAQELDEAVMRGEGTTEDAMESLRLLWPAYFADPDHPPPMPRMDISVPCSAQTWESIHSHLSERTLEEELPSIRVPCVFVLGGASPIPPRHGEATATLISGASVVVVEGCGHFPWLEHAGVVRLALDRIAKA